MRRPVFILLIVLLSISGTGCSIEPVKPWEKDLLAQKKMQLTPNPLEAYLDEHIYFSKEASSGGSGVGGGGCGCN
jgi:cytochrome c biogenesis protein ResB